MKKYLAHNSLLSFYLAHQVDANTNAYNLCFSYQLKNESSVNLLIEKLQKLIKSQAHLRQTFNLDHNNLLVRVYAQFPADIQYFAISSANLEQLEKQLVKEQHDVNKHSSIRLNIISLSDSEEIIALFNIHHIIMDGHSLEHFITDLNQLIAGKEIVKENPDTYIERVKKETPLQENTSDPEIKDYLESVESIANSMDYLDTNTKTDVWNYNDVLPESVMHQLVTTSKQHSISIFNLLLMAWSIFVAKLSNQKTMLVNYPVNIRNDKSIPGCFINTLLLPLNLKETDTYLSQILPLRDKTQLYKKIARMKQCQQFNLGPISSFACSNFAKPVDLVIDHQHLIAKVYDQIANSNLSIKYKEYYGSLIFNCNILPGIFPEYVTSSLLPRFFNFINKLLVNPNQLLAHIDLTFNSEQRRVLYEFNQTHLPFPQNKTLIDLFEEQVQKTPELTALVFNSVRLSYKELNEKANQLAHYLTNHHRIKPDDFVALLLDRNEYALIAILAVLKAGGAYVPLDLSYPHERINYILDDTQVKMILVNEMHQDKLKHLLPQEYFDLKPPKKSVDIIPIDSHTIQVQLAEQPKTNIITADISTNLAYVIYTSGTTGKPKGVMIEHKSVVNTLHYLTKIYKRNPEKPDLPLKITAFTSYAFDVSVSEMFIALLQGDELHLLSNTLRQDILQTSKYINDNQINYLYLPPVLLASLPKIKYPSLEAIIYAGEPCDSETALYWSDKTRLYNYYGPTETAIYATGLQLEAGEVNLIGKPISNTTTYVLNKENVLQPIGIIGELYIGGQGVAKGYLNQRELTDERFISNPFQTKDEKIQAINARLYKTGDLVRWRPDGNLEYIGRNDFQVKIRGYRIELGEIEYAIASHPEVKQAVVTVCNHKSSDESTNHKFLVGYYVSTAKIEENRFLDYLALHLPDYMQPSVLIKLEHLPVTANGKLDRRALPLPVFNPGDNYSPPTNEKEILVCMAFSKILSIPKVGINDDFFKLGGNSIMAISLVSNLQANFNINVTDIYYLKTPKKIASDTPFIKDNLRKNLEKIRSDYQSEINTPTCLQRFQNKLDTYYSATDQIQINPQKTSIVSVLLTGATGFLGCNLLHTLLATTEYRVFLLVRAPSHEEAFSRMNQKFKFYFEQELNQFNNKRLFVYAGDIEQRDLGLSKNEYQLLVTQIDSIIHSAALTKHYGDYDTFYLANVQATHNLLELSKLTKAKNFHYISTASVLNEGYVPGCDQYVFTEDDEGDNLEERSNIYVKTKYEGEKIVIKYRTQGINSTIYRVGNLAFIADSYKSQENIEDNGFFTRLNCLINLGMIAPEIGIEEISPVDLTAQAIISLFDKGMHNRIFHVYNPAIYNLGEILTQDASFNVTMVPIYQFITNIITLLSSTEYQQSIELFLLHQRWLNEQQRYTTNIHIRQDRTLSILKQLGFEWTTITNEAILKYLKREIARGKNKQYS